MFSGHGCSYHDMTGTHPNNRELYRSSDMEAEHHQEEDKRTNFTNFNIQDGIRDKVSRLSPNPAFSHAYMNSDATQISSEWLQLGIGRQTGISDENIHHLDRTAENRQGSLELNLFSGRAEGGASGPHALPNPTMMRNGRLGSTCLPETSSEASVGPYSFRRPNYHSHGTRFTSPYNNNNLDFRVIDRPRQNHSCIWFYLQALQNQANEPFLPQLTKSYLRIKDGRMTVRLLRKYLAKKLYLDNESEIGIECRGQKVEAWMTIEHVRDMIWSGKELSSVTLLPNSISDHVMILHYARI